MKAHDIPALALAGLTFLSGCGEYHNPKDVAQIKQLQTQLDAANARADAIQERLAIAAEVSADAQSRQAAAAQMEADHQFVYGH